MSRPLFVGNLSIGVTDRDLHALFARAGHVRTARVITSRSSGQSTGSAIVEMCQEKEGAVAIALLNEHEHLGRQLIVRVATFRDASDSSRVAAV